MCDLCTKIKENKAYASFIDKMYNDDLLRLENSKKLSTDLKTLTHSIYSSVKWPIKLDYPIFEARAAYSVPHNYFQSLVINDEKQPNAFAHGSMRSLFFVDNRLFVFSKNVAHDQTLDFFSSFLLMHLEKEEYKLELEDEHVIISASLEKPMRNLITNKVEKTKVEFTFVNESVKNRIVSKEQVSDSGYLKGIYEKYGGLANKISSIDLEGYAITVPHFSPHPYLLQIHKELGFESNRDFQERVVVDYFRNHF